MAEVGGFEQAAVSWQFHSLGHRGQRLNTYMLYCLLGIGMIVYTTQPISITGIYLHIHAHRKIVGQHHACIYTNGNIDTADDREGGEMVYAGHINCIFSTILFLNIVDN